MIGSTWLALEEARISGVDVRKGDAADYPRIAALAEAVYGAPRSIESLRWLYDANPAGGCRVWLAEDSRSGDIVALRPVFPWRIRVKGRDILVAQAGDAMTHPAHRGRGLFSALVRASWSELRDKGIPFSFSFSNPGSLSVYRKITVGKGRRAGTHAVLEFQRMVYPLSLEVLRERVPVPERLAGRADAAYQAVQRWRWRLPAHLTTFTVERFDEEFDDLWARTADRFTVLTVRDSRYLNWRFFGPPTAPYHIIGLRSHGRLAGYVAFDVDADGNGYIADLFGAPEAEIVRALLAAAASAMLDRGYIRISLGAATDGAMFGWIRAFGFVARDDIVPMAVHVYHDGPLMDDVLRPGGWLAWFGDRDVEHLASSPFRR